MAKAIQLLQELVSINSVNPDLVPGAVGETEVVMHCATWLRSNGFEVHILEERKGRPSVVGIAKGSGGGRSLMFNGHIDTVTLSGYAGDPLAAEIKNGNVQGRGTYDMKGGVAAMMVAAANAAKKGLRGNLVVACVGDEEYASAGTYEVLRKFRADAAIVPEPTDLNISLAHRGFVWFDIVIEGHASHGSRYDLGIDAIVKAGYFLVALDEYGKRLLTDKGHPLVGPGSVHASLIKGGEELSSYPALCRISIERRTAPGETGDMVEAELRKLLDGTAKRDPQFRYRLERGLERPPFEQDANGDIVQIVKRHATRDLGREATIRGEAYWTDAALLREAGIPTVILGVAGVGAHAATEYADVSSVESLSRILEWTAVEYCS